MQLTEICSNEEILQLGILPAEIFTFIADADNDVAIIEAKEFSVFFLKFYNYYYGSFMTAAIEETDKADKIVIQKLCRQIKNNHSSYFRNIKEIIDRFPVNEREIIIFLVKDLSVRIASATTEFDGLGGSKISRLEQAAIRELYKAFKIDN